jgi:hypothetical protein
MPTAMHYNITSKFYAKNCSFLNKEFLYLAANTYDKILFLIMFKKNIFGLPSATLFDTII